MFCSNSYAVKCDYSIESDVYIKSFQTDVYNSRSWLELADANGNGKRYRVYDGDVGYVQMIMNSARLAFLFKNKVAACYYDYGTYRMLYNLELL